MNLKFTELTTKNDMLKTYSIYKHCMFMPTEEKFQKQINEFIKNKSIKSFVATTDEEAKGVIVVDFYEKNKIIILGIAVDKSCRHNKIGSFMINKLIKNYELISVYAETDADAVEFYRKNGFNITEFSENYNGETVTRYKCKLTDYKSEVKKKWGNSKPYKEYCEKAKEYTADKQNILTDGINNIIIKFSNNLNNNICYNSVDTQKLVAELQNFITENYYTCTKEILMNLGKMYVSDERFKINIDKHSVGTAEYINRAIEAYCE